MGVFCVAASVLLRDHAEFYNEAQKRWERLESKRKQSSVETQIEQKRRCALKSDGTNWSAEPVDVDAVDGCAADTNTKSTSKISAAMDGNYAFKTLAEKAAIREKCQKAWDHAFIMCGIPWSIADNPYFRAAIHETRRCLDFKNACSKTMSTTRLNARNDEANVDKEARMRAGRSFGFLITSDGWRSSSKRNYHNYILVSVEGAIFLNLVECTGESGTGESVADGFEKQFAKLTPDILDNIVLGVTDTPTANRKAWRLLEAKHPKQIWIGCATHEVNLLFKEWVKKTPDILQLFYEGLRVVKWINNHAEILKLFRATVPSHFVEDKKKHSIGLYMPGDTRMATVFRMLFRIKVLYQVLRNLVSLPEYDVASQKALKMWSDNQPPEKKLIPINGKFVDKVKHSIQSDRFQNEIDTFIRSTKSAMYLLRLVDGQTPVIGKFYYACALVDKHLRVMKEMNNVAYIDQLRSIFAKRWKRWHRPIHTLAYALDPCYQSHELSREEKRDVNLVSSTHSNSTHHPKHYFIATADLIDYDGVGPEENCWCKLGVSKD